MDTKYVQKLNIVKPVGKKSLKEWEREGFKLIEEDNQTSQDGSFSGLWGDSQSNDNNQPSEKWSAEELSAWANEHEIPIGMATTPKGIYDKIKASGVI